MKISNSKFQIASLLGHKQIVNKLIDNGSDVNASNSNGDTALILGKYFIYFFFV